MTALLIGIYLLIGGLVVGAIFILMGYDGKEALNEILERVHSLEGDRFMQIMTAVAIGLGMISIWPAYVVHTVYLIIKAL